MHFVELVSLQYCFILNVFVPDNPQPLETPSGKMETMASIKTNRGPVPHSHRHFIKAQLFQIFSNPSCTSSTSKPQKRTVMKSTSSTSRPQHIFHTKFPRKPFSSQACCFSQASAIRCSSLAASSHFSLAIHSLPGAMGNPWEIHGKSMGNPWEIQAGSGWNWRARPFNHDINNKYMDLIWPQGRTKIGS